MLQVDRIVNSIFDSITWLLSETNSNQVWLVDCGDMELITEKAKGKVVTGVLLTHAHFDHIYGLPELLLCFPECMIYTNTAGKEALQSAKDNLSKYYEHPIEIVGKNIEIVKEGDYIGLFEGFSAKVYEMPGHHPSCVVFEIGDSLFSGDSYIPGIQVVTNLPGGDNVKAIESKERIVDMLPGLQLRPGHATEINI